MKPLDAKVQIHRLAIKYRELSDLPFKNEKEKDAEADLLLDLKNVIDSVKFKNEIDQEDFDEFVRKELDGTSFEIPDMPEPESETIKDAPLHDELEEEKPVQVEYESIIPIAKQRQKKEILQKEINELKKEKEYFRLVSEKNKLKEEVEKMRQKQSDEEKEASFYTDKKDKEGISKLRKEKWQRDMDNLKTDKIILEQELKKRDPEKEKEEYENIKEAIKVTDKKITRLKTIKYQNYGQQAMVKIPRWINKAMSSIGEVTQGMGKEFGGMGFEEKGKKSNFGFGFGDDFGGKSNDFGFNEASMFGNKKSESKPKKKRKSKKKKKK